MRYYGYYTDNAQIKSNLTNYLKNANIIYEVSGCYDGWHFEILLDESGVENVNSFLDLIS